jgi:hypothetical protein
MEVEKGSTGELSLEDAVDLSQDKLHVYGI